jgi:hypothetical protein
MIISANVIRANATRLIFKHFPDDGHTATVQHVMFLHQDKTMGTVQNICQFNNKASS